jgi:hypothetical protein
VPKVLSVAQRCYGQPELKRAYAHKPHLNRRLKTNQHKFPDHPAAKDDSRKHSGSLSTRVTSEYRVASHQVTPADSQEQNQPGKEEAMKGVPCSHTSGKGIAALITAMPPAIAPNPLRSKSVSRMPPHTVSESSLFGWLASISFPSGLSMVVGA